MQSSTKPNKNIKIVSYTLLFLALISALSGAIIMTDIGQIFGIDKSWIIWYFSNRTMIQVISLLLLVAAVFLLNREKFLSAKVIVILGICWLGAMVASKYLTPFMMFRSQQHDSKYITIAEAADYMNDEDRVLVVDHNGVQKAYPPEVIWQAHIFGGDFGGDEVIFTYCVMTNLASPYLNDINGETVDFKVLAQVNNNLLIWDTKSDEIIQQITQKCEFSDYKLDPLPVLEMTWGGYKKLFPEGTVVYNSWDDPMEKLIAAIFSTDDTWNGDDWMFNTANLDDKRLPSKEHIIGVRDDDKNEQLALTKAYIKEQGVCNVSVGDKKIALVYFPEYETIVGFDRLKEGTEIQVDQIDVFGNTPDLGQLKRVYIYNSVLWGVWAAYYPDSRVLK